MIEIGKEYGTALFMLACEKNEQDICASALAAVKDAFLENPQYTELLSSPSISLKERLELIENCFSDHLPEYVLSYLKLMCEKGRIQYLLQSVEEYQALLNASKHIVRARITSAVELTDSEKKMLIQKLEAQGRSKVCAEYFVDESLLGGLTVEIDGKIMDGSLRHRLHEVKEVINT